MGGKILYAENSSVSILRDFSTVEFKIYIKNTHTIQRQKIPQSKRHKNFRNRGDRTPKVGISSELDKSSIFMVLAFHS